MSNLRKYEIELEKRAKRLKSDSNKPNNYERCVEIRKEYLKIKDKIEFTKNLLNAM